MYAETAREARPALDDGVDIRREDADLEMGEDEAVLVRLARQDPTAFAHLYQRYRRRIYAYLLVRAGDEDDAADLTQHVFLKALDALPRYHARTLPFGQPVPFGAWLFRIARNAATDLHRHRHATVPWEDIPEAQHPLMERGPEDEALRQEALARLRALVRALDSDTRDLLALRFVARLSAAEIGGVIGKSAAATHKRLARVTDLEGAVP